MSQLTTDHLLDGLERNLGGFFVEDVLLTAFDLKTELLSQNVIEEMEKEGSFDLTSDLVAPQCLSEIDHGLFFLDVLEIHLLRSLLGHSIHLRLDCLHVLQDRLHLVNELLALGIVLLGFLGEVAGHVLLHLEELGILEHLVLNLVG